MSARSHAATLARAIGQYLVERRSMGAPPSTLAAYSSDLYKLRSLAPRDSALEFSEALVRLYFRHFADLGCSAATIARKHSALNEFAKWGILNGLWRENPLAKLRRPKKPDRLPRPFEGAERNRLMALPLPPTEHALRAVLYYTGLRVSPVCALLIGDVDFTPYAVRAADGPEIAFPGSIRTIGKGNKPLVTPMHPALAEVLQKHMLASTDLRPSSRVFLQAHGKPFRRATIEKLAARWGLAANVAGCTPHRVRHTFATDLLEQGVDIRVIQTLLGHSDIKTTMLYAKVRSAQTAAAILRLPVFRTES